MPPLPFGKVDQSFQANLGLLRDCLRDFKVATQGVERSIDTYQTNLAELDQRLEELHDRLDDTKKAHDNVEETLLALERVLVKFDIPRQVEDTLEKGRDADFEQYLQSYDKVVEAKVAIQSFLRKSGGLKPAKDAAARLEKLAHNAERTLDNMFRDTLQLGSCVVDPKEQAPEWLRNPNYFPILLHHGSLDTLLKIASRLMKTSVNYTKHIIEVQGKVVLDSIERCFEKQGNGSSPRASEAANYRKGSHSYLTCLLFLLRLAATEHQICKLLLNADPDVASVVDAVALPDSALAAQLTRTTILKAVGLCIAEGEAIAEENSFAYSDGVFVMLDILEHLANVRPALQQLGLDTDFAPLVKKLRHNALQLVMEYIPVVEQNEVKCSSDGVVHQVTTNTLHYLIRLYDYYLMVEDLLSEDVSLRAVPGSGALQKYGQQLLRALQGNLDRKSAHQFKHQKELLVIFLLNNNHYIHHSLQQCPSLKRQASMEINRLEGVIRDLQSQYLAASWGKAIAILTEKFGPDIDRKITKHQGAGRLSSATKELIKELFSEFFEEFDSKYHQQLHFNVPDDHLRSSLQQLICQEVLPRYKCVVDKYGSLSFSTHVAKYIKYDIKTLETMIEAMFQGKLRKG